MLSEADEHLTSFKSHENQKTFQVLLFLFGSDDTTPTERSFLMIKFTYKGKYHTLREYLTLHPNFKKTKFYMKMMGLTGKVVNSRGNLNNRS